MNADTHQSLLEEVCRQLDAKLNDLEEIDG